MKERSTRSLGRRIALAVTLGILFTLLLVWLWVGVVLLALTEENRTLLICLSVGLSLLFLFLSLFFGVRLSRRLIAPLRPFAEQGGKGSPPYLELLPLFSRLAEQDTAIEKQLKLARRKEEEFRVLSENMTEGLVVVDRHGRTVSVNASARSFMEEGSGEEEVNAVLSAALGGRHTERALAREGRFYRLTGSPVMQNERIVGAVSLLLDETQKKSLEQYRREFTANVSHELKTPLTSISGFAELLQNGLVAGEDVPDFAAGIYTEARRLLTLVNDIIRLSRIEDGSQPYEHAPVDLYRLAEEALDHVRPAAEAAGISLVLEGEPQELEGAEPILYDVIFNLCDNAVKYNREGGFVRVWVGEGETGVLLSVEDGGIGIPAEHRERIFERFYRVDKSHSREIGGTGLGLSIVRHGVEYHGGEVTLTSEEGVGTKVTVVFQKQNGAPQA